MAKGGGLRWGAAQLREFEQRRTGVSRHTDEPRKKVETESERLAWSLLSPLGFEREFQFDTARRWRLDFAHVELRIAVEIEGQVHRIEGRFERDLEKYNRASLDGWTLLRFTPASVLNDHAFGTIWQAMVIKRARLEHGRSDGNAKSAA